MKKHINHIIRQGESETTEFKTSFSAEVMVSLVAFANTKGGSVYVGIADDGAIKGVKLGKETLQNWINEIKAKTQPSIIPSVEVFKEESKQIVCIGVNEFPVKPLCFKGRFYKQINNSNHQLSVSEISEVYLQSMQYSWDSYPYATATFKDINTKK